MRLPLFIFVVSFAAAAQTQPASGFIRGTLLECEPASGGGEFSVRSASHEVYRYRFDSRTWVERESERIDGSRLHPGELVEVVADRGPANTLRYARTVHVVQPAPPPRAPSSLGRFRAYRSTAESMVPRGTMTFAGVVSRINAQQLVLHTRAAGEQTILLRQDTRFLDGGTIVERALLNPNTRVFVRAGKDLYGVVEAYQVIWGEILQPDAR
jgi:hypothetical protein